MTTGKDILAKAKSHLGEDGHNTWKAYNTNGTNWGTGWAWCCAFVWRVFKECGASKLFYGGGKTASVGTEDAWFYKNCKWVKYSEAKAGDVVIFTWKPTGPGNTRSGLEKSHTGIFEKRVDANQFYCIEGNTGDPARVRRRLRTKNYIYAIYRPNYPVETKPVTPSKPKPTTAKKKYSGVFPKIPARGYFRSGDGGKTGSTNVKNLQKLLNWINGSNLKVDGRYGEKTHTAVKAAQKKLKVKVDGRFGAASLAAAKAYKK